MTDDFVPEADAMEQDQEVAVEPDATDEPDLSEVPEEADEADALEQAQVVAGNEYDTP